MGVAAGPAFSKLTTAPIQRRERRAVTMRGYAVRDDGSSHEILVLDLSYEGCGIETPLALESGERIKLSVLRRGAIDAVVRWCKRGKAGLVFIAEDPGAHAPCARRFQRVGLTAEVRLRRLGKANFQVAVTDASPDGCKVELVERPAVGEHVLVKFDGLEALEAEVCWVEEFTAGLRFEKPMHPAVSDRRVERLTA
jgi:hypothetical protein